MPTGSNNESGGSTELTFALLERALRATAVPYAAGLSPIVFEITSVPNSVWSFDPSRRDRLFAPGDIAAAPLRLRCPVALLLGLLTAEGPGNWDGLSFSGDLEPLERLLTYLEPAQTALALRAGGDPT